MRMFIDTALSGRPKYNERGVPDSEQPKMVRLAWLLETDEGRTVADASHLIRLPNGRRMEGQAAHVTGIYDQHLLMPHAFSLSEVMSEFGEALGKVEWGGLHGYETGLAVAHNWSHHRQVLERAYRELGWPARTWPEGFCVMTKGAPVTRIPRMSPSGGWKTPTFDECMDILIGKRLYAPTMNPVEDGRTRVLLVRQFYQRIVG